MSLEATKAMTMANTTSSTPTEAGQATTAPVILLYSDDVTVREHVRMSVGPRLTAGAVAIDWREVATPSGVVTAADAGGLDLMILDGEADKAGGMGLCRQLKNEIYNCPPVLVLTGRPQDGWLASWSLADDAVPRPLDPIEVQRAVAALLAPQA